MEPDETRPTGAEWLEAFARDLGVSAPSADDVEAILALAGMAAHASERTAAPVACWVAAQAGVSVAEAARVATGVRVERTDGASGSGAARAQSADG
jgi:hypothetical protein